MYDDLYDIKKLLNLLAIMIMLRPFWQVQQGLENKLITILDEVKVLLCKTLGSPAKNRCTKELPLSHENITGWF